MNQLDELNSLIAEVNTYLTTTRKEYQDSQTEEVGLSLREIRENEYKKLQQRIKLS